MSEVFQNITDVVQGTLKDIVTENEKRNTQNRLDGIEEEDNIADEFNQKDFLNDFATEEFITKNIRIQIYRCSFIELIN